MATLSQISVLFSANTAQFISGLTGMDTATKKWSKQIQRDFKNAGQDVQRILKGMTVAYGAFATAVAVGTAKSVENISQIADEAEKMGSSASRLMALGEAAKMSGTDLETLKRGFTEIQKTVNEAAQGNVTAIEAFNRLGLSVSKLGEMRPEDRFAAIAQALNKISDPVERSRIGMDVLGKSFVELTPTINMGVEGLNEMALAAASTGASLADIDVQRVKELGDNWERMQSNFTGMFNVLAASLAPILNKIFGDLDKWLKKDGNTMKVITDLLSGLATPVYMVAASVDFLRAGFLMGQAAIINFAGVGAESLSALLYPIKLVADAFDKLNNGIIDGLNATIDAINSFTGSEIPKIEFKFDAGDSIQKLRNDLASFKIDAISTVADLTKEADDIFQRGFGSGITDFVASLLNNASGTLGRATEQAVAANASAAAAAGNAAGTNILPQQDGKEEAAYFKRLEQLSKRYHSETRKWEEETAQIKEAHLWGYISLQEKSAALLDLEIARFQQSKTWISGAASAMQSFADSMANAIVNGESLGDVFKGLLKQIAAMVLRSLILNVILSAIGLASPVAAGALANLMGMQGYGGARAEGGPVQSGKTYLVGENGMEMFTPNTNGYIVPNNELAGSAAGGKGVTVVQNISIETGVSQTVRSEMLGLLPMFREQSLAAVAQATARGGGISKQIRGF